MEARAPSAAPRHDISPVPTCGFRPRHGAPAEPGTPGTPPQGHGAVAVPSLSSATPGTPRAVPPAKRGPGSQSPGDDGSGIAGFGVPISLRNPPVSPWVSRGELAAGPPLPRVRHCPPQQVLQRSPATQPGGHCAGAPRPASRTRIMINC